MNQNLLYNVISYSNPTDKMELHRSCSFSRDYPQHPTRNRSTKISPTNPTSGSVLQLYQLLNLIEIKCVKFLNILLYIYHVPVINSLLSTLVQLRWLDNSLTLVFHVYRTHPCLQSIEHANQHPAIPTECQATYLHMVRQESHKSLP